MKTHYLRSVCAAALLSAPVTAQAQETVFDIGEIIISASQTPVEENRTGASVEVVQGSDLTTKAPAKIAEGLAQLPGISTSANGGFGTSTSISIRGLPDRYIAVRLNGIDITDPSSVQTQLNWGAFTASGISRIEVLKGSQSAIFGSEAIGGVVSLYTAMPDEIGTTVTTSFEFGSYNTTRASFGVATKGERGEVSLNITNTNTDGFSAAEENDGNSEKDGYEGVIALLSFAYDVTDRTRAGIDAIYQDENTNIDASGGAGGDADRPFLSDRRGARAWVQHQTGAWDHEFAFSRFITERRDVNTPFGSPNFTGERSEVTYKASGEIGATKLTFGAEYSEETARTSGGTFSSEVLSLFGEAQFAVSDDLDISTALRVDDHSEFGTEPSGRVALAWRPASDTVVRAALSTGFRAPSLNELFGPFNFAGPPTLEPETSRSFELGVTQTYSAAVIEATAFYTEIDNLISYPTNGYEQVPGTSVTKGVELSGRYDISDRYSVFGAYTYTDAEDANGNQLRRVPRHDFVLGLDAEINDRWSGQIALQHIADRANDGFPAAPMDDYTVVNASIAYNISDSAQAYLRIENLTDEEYQTSRGYGTSDRAAFFGIRASF